MVTSHTEVCEVEPAKFFPIVWRGGVERVKIFETAIGGLRELMDVGVLPIRRRYLPPKTLSASSGRQMETDG